MLRGFPPVVAADTHTLILGSFPGEASLAATQYYAHPRNQFWRLLGAVLNEPSLHDLPYDARLERVLAHGIGIWDVLDACHRQGSLDSAIRNAQPNDFDSLREHGTGAMGTAATTLGQMHFIYTYYKDQYNALFPGTVLDPAMSPNGV